MSDKIEIVNSIKITVVYDTTRNKGQNDFNTLQELKLWLDKNPNLAKKLGYSKK
jgi:hypothetical protein